MIFSCFFAVFRWYQNSQQSLNQVCNLRGPILCVAQFHQRSRYSFYTLDSERVKRYWQLDWVLTLWGATGVKAVRRCWWNRAQLHSSVLNQMHFSSYRLKFEEKLPSSRKIISLLLKFFELAVRICMRGHFKFEL